MAVIAVAVAGYLAAAPDATRRPAKPPAATPYRPPPIAPLVHPALRGEGTWRAAERWAPRPAPILLATFRPDPAQPSILAYVAWIRTSSTQLALYPGYKGPGPTTLPRGPMQVPQSARRRLLATFNSGFYEKDAPGGFYVRPFLYAPFNRGLATVVAYKDGHVDVGRWSAGARPGPSVVMARQNLPLFVDHGRANPALDVSEKWGFTLHGVPSVWRTGLGIDRQGNLIYVAAPQQTAPSLARILVHSGAVRAMELDINPEWPIFVTYSGRGARGPALFMPNPNQIPERFLSPSTKDFFAVYQRITPGNPGEPYR